MTATNYSDGSLNTVKITTLCTAASGCAAGTSFTLTFASIKNAGSTRTIDKTGFVIYTTNAAAAGGYMIDQSSNSLITFGSLVISPHSLTVALTTPNPSTAGVVS